MTIVKRLRRAAKELLGRKQLPSPEAILVRSYEEQLYQGLVRSGDTCFDIGANAGDVALFLAKLAGDQGLILAFEPVWPMYKKLCRLVQRDLALKAPILPVPYGFADSIKQTTVQVPAGDFGMGSIAEASAWASAQSGVQLSSYKIQLDTIDNFLATTGFAPPDFIKIDVEGAELLVLQGAVDLFRAGSRPLMLIEVFAPWERAFGYKPWELLSWLMEREYRFLFACPSGLVEHLPTQADPYPAGYESGYNIIAYHPQIHSARMAGLQSLRAENKPRLLSMAPPPQPNR